VDELRSYKIICDHCKHVTEEPKVDTGRQTFVTCGPCLGRSPVISMKSKVPIVSAEQKMAQEKAVFAEAQMQKIKRSRNKLAQIEAMAQGCKTLF